MKGGGGAFAAVLEVVYKAHEPPAGFVGVFGTFSIDPKADGVEIWQELIRKWIEVQPDLGKAGFAGYSYVVSRFTTSKESFRRIDSTSSLLLETTFTFTFRLYSTIKRYRISEINFRTIPNLSPVKT